MRKKRKKVNLIPIILLIFLFSSCNINDPEEINFKDWEKKQFDKSFIKLFNQKATFYDGIPTVENFMIGKLEQENNKIYFKTDKIRFVLFDFSLPVGNCIKIHYKKSTLLSKNYFLCKEDAFFDKLRNDSIYKFCFKKYKVFNNNNGVVYFVSKTNGILGCYLVDYSNSNNIPMINEIMFGEVFENRYHYERYTRFTIK
ncbi:hypothetical protein [Flavobacterium sp.]|uniref:hypothetical protein n=1 Tax=Flavobacterium sp. TaxID=239 RepID=UPI00391C325B